MTPVAARALAFACCLGYSGMGLAQEAQIASPPVRTAATAETAPAAAASTPPPRAAAAAILPSQRTAAAAEERSPGDLLAAIKVYPLF